MARNVMSLAVAILLNLATIAISHPEPDAPLSYPNNIVFASSPLLRQQVVNNAAYPQNPALVVAAQLNPTPQNHRIIASAVPANAAPQGTVFQIVSEGAPAQVQSLPRNFVTFTRTPSQPIQSAQPVQSPPSNFLTFTQTPSQQFIQSAEPVQSFPSNFVTFTRAPSQQYVQSPEPVQSPARPSNFVTLIRTPSQQFVQSPEPVQSPALPSNFVTFSRTAAPGQDFGTRTFLGSPSQQVNEQTAARTPKQFGVRTVFVPATKSDAAATAANTASPAQQTGVQTVFVFSPQQANSHPVRTVPQSAKSRTVLVTRPVQDNEQFAPAANIENQPAQVSSSQFFTRNFGGSGTLTYFIRPVSASAPATKLVQSSNQPSREAET